MSHYRWILDAGHGGINPNGQYTTPSEKGKEYHFEGGRSIYEGQINRLITSRLINRLENGGIDHDTVYNDVLDTPLRERVQKADELFDQYFRQQEPGQWPIYLSVHSNAMTEPSDIEGEGSDASYFSVWTSKGQTKSDIIAEKFADSYKAQFPDKRFAGNSADGDADMEADFYVLRKYDGPAILVENLFFDNQKDAEFLLSVDGQDRIAECLYLAIQECESSRPI